MISKPLISAITKEHREHFDDGEITWINYPFTSTHQIGIGYGGQANFSNIFALASDVEEWAIANKYVIDVVNESTYKYDDPYSYDDYSIEIKYSFTVRHIDEKLPFVGKAFCKKDRLASYEVKLAAIFAAGDYVLQQIDTGTKDNHV